MAGESIAEGTSDGSDDCVEDGPRNSWAQGTTAKKDPVDGGDFFAEQHAGTAHTSGALGKHDSSRTYSAGREQWNDDHVIGQAISNVLRNHKGWPRLM